ncbi:cupin domain-containing protein [bacterium]|nr:cupin domain-containing protein [bacterium]
MEIVVEKNADKTRLRNLGVEKWPIWEKEASEFPWHYDADETCYLLKGEVEVIPEKGMPVKFSAGDLVIFPAGLSCTWKIRKAVKKHYKLG